jgi:hypothetical protein
MYNNSVIAPGLTNASTLQRQTVTLVIGVYSDHSSKLTSTSDLLVVKSRDS